MGGGIRALYELSGGNPFAAAVFVWLVWLVVTVLGIAATGWPVMRKKE